MTRANGLSLAASPTFALMALLTHVYGSDMICITGPDTPIWSGMVPMYLLMSLFHATPWLTVIRRTQKIEQAYLLRGERNGPPLFRGER